MLPGNISRKRRRNNSDNLAEPGSEKARVARWYSFKPRIQIWVFWEGIVMEDVIFYDLFNL
jgi:hypothetical protein